MRVEVKTGAEFGASALSGSGPVAGRFVRSLDALARTQHAPSNVAPFSVTAFGCLSPPALWLLKELESRSPDALPCGVSLGWTVPTHQAAWRRRFRMIALSGLCTSIRALSGGPDSITAREPDCSPEALAMHRTSRRPDLYPAPVPDSCGCVCAAAGLGSVLCVCAGADVVFDSLGATVLMGSNSQGSLLSSFSTNRCSGLMLWCLGLWCVVSLFSLIVQLVVLGLLCGLIVD